MGGAIRHPSIFSTFENEIGHREQRCVGVPFMHPVGKGHLFGSSIYFVSILTSSISDISYKARVIVK
jgi:hypothetical protein